MNSYFPFGTIPDMQLPSVLDVLKLAGAGFHAIMSTDPDPTVYLLTSAWALANTAMFYWTLDFWAAKKDMPTASRAFWATYFSVAVIVWWQYGQWTGSKLLSYLWGGSYRCSAAARAAQPYLCTLLAVGTAAFLLALLLGLAMVWLVSLFSMGAQLAVSILGPEEPLGPSPEQLHREQEARAMRQLVEQRRITENLERRRQIQEAEDAAADALSDAEEAAGTKAPDTPSKCIQRLLRRHRQGRIDSQTLQAETMEQSRLAREQREAAAAAALAERRANMTEEERAEERRRQEESARIVQASLDAMRAEIAARKRERRERFADTAQAAEEEDTRYLEERARVRKAEREEAERVRKENAGVSKEPKMQTGEASRPGVAVYRRVTRSSLLALEQEDEEDD